MRNRQIYQNWNSITEVCGGPGPLAKIRRSPGGARAGGAPDWPGAWALAGREAGGLPAGVLIHSGPATRRGSCQFCYHVPAKNQ